MSRRPPRFQQADVTRALRAAQKVGGNWAVEIAPDGTIRMVPAEPVARQARTHRSTSAADGPVVGGFSREEAPPRASRASDPKASRVREILDISERISSNRPRSQAQHEYEKAQDEYDDFRQRLIAERRARRRPGVCQPPLSDIPELASAAAALNEKLDAFIDETNAIWDEAERESLSRSSK
jgi:hypothetical protein